MNEEEMIGGATKARLAGNVAREDVARAARAAERKKEQVLPLPDVIAKPPSKADEYQNFPFRLRRDELDQKLGGGLPKHAFVVIEAKNTLGKSILAQRFTFGFLEHGLSVTYVSTELSLPGFFNQMKSLNYDVQDYMLSGQMLFVSLYPHLGDSSIGDDILNRLRVERLFESDIIVFDALSEFVIPKEITRAESFDLITFFKKITSKGKSVVFCIDPDQFDNEFSSLLKSICDVYLRLDVKEHFGKLTKIIKIERFNGAMNEVESEIPFKVRPGIGIVIDIASSS
ncbi:hypothetical protein D6783_06065 [Candidatus Woesearchaeota archaeon]|nr:MAG: hypothetical protein D6783_06065 [Candidatus Woesearchaeota archaeon]